MKKHLYILCIAAFCLACQLVFGYTLDWTANNLNQYTSILRASASPREITHDLDGNMLSDGNLTFTYDAANRLKTVSSNGVLLVTNFYDAKSRRVKKVTPESTTIFFYDGWNLIEERIAYTNGTSSTIRYFWGKDLSGSLQGAGGVGGLLYLTVSNSQLQLYVPNYDNIGNIIRYLDANGNTVAQYTYDAFGNTLSHSGTLANLFRHRFSTKYYDAETGLYYYGYRFYSPSLMRWLNRDPIGELDCPNLYCPFGNRPTSMVDPLGKAVIVLTDTTPTRMASITVQRGDRIVCPRGITTITGSPKFSCDKKCILHVNGIIQLWIELLDENNPRWDERYPRYSGNPQRREDQNTLSHEMDHFNTWNAFLNFVKTANSFDGKKFSDCQDRARRYDAAYQRYKAITSEHSRKFDDDGWNIGNQYSRHPLDTSKFKWD